MMGYREEMEKHEKRIINKERVFVAIYTMLCILIGFGVGRGSSSHSMVLVDKGLINHIVKHEKYEQGRSDALKETIIGIAAIRR